MKATFTKTEHTGKIASNRKENGGFSQEYTVLVTDKRTDQSLPYVKEGRTMQSVIIARIYWSKGATCYACVWVHGSSAPKNPVSTSGGGKAGGYGYHKASAALEAALDDAGVVLSEAIGGRGESAMTDALAAMARALGYRRFHIHNAHA